MSPHAQLARDGLALVAVTQGVATLAIDTGRAHARNPRWTPHARFHALWQSLSTMLLQLLAACVALRGRGDASFVTAFAITAIPCLTFLGACAMRRAIGAELSDPGGIAPLPLGRGRGAARVDMNLLAVAAGCVALGALAWCYIA